jgi:flagellar L-ring protein precursor FlgH
MNRLVLILLIAAAAAGSASAARHYSIYGDRKGKKADDVLTVLIVEEASAINKTLTDTEKETDVELNTTASRTGLMRFLPNWSFSGKNGVDYRGRGETSRRGEFKAKVTARIVEVQDNGNLLIQGSKMVEINNEKEIIHVSGVVRPEDIWADNTVYSYSIADAKITYTGNGVTHSAQKPGWVTRFFNWIF